MYHLLRGIERKIVALKSSKIMVQQLQHLIEIIKNHVQLSEPEKVSMITQLMVAFMYNVY